MTALSSLLVLVVATALLSAVPAQPAAAAAPQTPSLWLTDDETATTYNVTLDGELITKFPTPGTRRAESSIAIDPVDRTLWGTNDGSAARLVNYDRTGRVLTEIPATTFGGVNTEGLDVTVSSDDVTLWVVDDPVSGPTVPTVYNVSKSGQLLSSFPTATFDAQSTSPQAIAYDPYTSSLWITDNASDTVYNVSLEGELLRAFDVNTAAFGRIGNIQGIGVESSQVLWITSRDTHRIYRVTKSGEEILSSFSIADVDPLAEDPSGVAFDRPPGYLGAAESFAALGLAGSELKLKDGDQSTGIVGDAGLGPDATQDFDSGLLAGTLVVDPSADNGNDHSVAISGGVEARDLALAAADAEFSSVAASVLAPTQVLGEIKDSSSIVGAADVNVIAVDKIDLDDGETLTLSGDPSSVFVLNVAERLKLNHASSIVPDGGLSAHNVFVNIEGSDDSSIEGGSLAVGTIVAPNAKMKIKGTGSMIAGTLIGGREIKLEDGGRLRDADAVLQPGDLGAAAAPTVLGLPGSRVKLADVGSTVVGDVALAPFARQEFDRGLIDGTLLVDPLADNTRTHSAVITGGTAQQAVALAAADAIDASAGAARLPADLVYPEIRTDTTVVGGPGLTVIDAKKIELDGGRTLTIAGDASSRFVFNLEEKVKLKDASSVVLTGGVSPDNVLFNVVGDKDSSIESASAAAGTILSPFGKVKVKDAGSRLRGAAIAGEEVVVEGAGEISRPE